MRTLIHRAGTGTRGLRLWAAPVAVAAILLVTGTGAAQASTRAGGPPNDFGMTMGSYQGQKARLFNSSQTNPNLHSTEACNKHELRRY